LPLSSSADKSKLNIFYRHFGYFYVTHFLLSMYLFMGCRGTACANVLWGWKLKFNYLKGVCVGRCGWVLEDYLLSWDFFGDYFGRGIARCQTSNTRGYWRYFIQIGRIPTVFKHGLSFSVPYPYSCGVHLLCSLRKG